MTIININIPKLNPNDEELLVVDILIIEGQNITKGDPICVYETTKTSVEFVSEYNGLMKKILIKKNKYYNVGEIAFELEILDKNPKLEKTYKSFDNENIEKKITLKAQKILKDNNISINQIKSTNNTVKAEDVIAYLNNLKLDKNNKKQNIIVGSGAHSCLIADVLIEEKKKLLGFISKSAANIGESIFNDIKVISSDELFEKEFNINDFNIYIGVGGSETNLDRVKAFTFWSDKQVSLPTLISSKANVSKNSKIGEGSVVLPGSTIGPNVSIGKNCIINNNSVVCHDTIIEDNVHLTPGSVVAGGCLIGKNTTIGMCATVFYGVKIGENCLVYNNATVIKNLDKNKIINNNGEIKEIIISDK